MGINATYQATLTVLGSTLGPGGGPLIQDTQVSQPTNTNAPGPMSAQLVAGNITIVLPPAATGFTYTKVVLMPAPASVNGKVLCTSGFARVIPSTVSNSWTTGSITLPAGPGDSLYITSAGTEQLLIGFA